MSRLVADGTRGDAIHTREWSFSIRVTAAQGGKSGRQRIRRGALSGVAEPERRVLIHASAWDASHCSAGGIAFRLLILSKPPIDFVHEYAFGIEQRRHAGSLDLSGTATLRDGSTQPIVLGDFGGAGGSTANRSDFRFWMPLPDDAVQAQLRLTWPTMQVDDTAEIDIHAFRLVLDPESVRNPHQP